MMVDKLRRKVSNVQIPFEATVWVKFDNILLALVKQVTEPSPDR